MCLGGMEGFSCHIRVWKIEFIVNLINSLRSYIVIVECRHAMKVSMEPSKYFFYLRNRELYIGYNIEQSNLAA